MSKSAWIAIAVIGGLALLAAVFFFVLNRPNVTNVGPGGTVDQSQSNGWDALMTGLTTVGGIATAALAADAAGDE